MYSAAAAIVVTSEMGTPGTLVPAEKASFQLSASVAAAAARQDHQTNGNILNWIVLKVQRDKNKSG